MAETISTLGPQFESMPAEAFARQASMAYEAGKQPAFVDAIKDFQAGRNLIETAWFNKYQYDMAQLNELDARSKLNYQDDYNKNLEQQTDQRAQLFPLQLDQQKQVNQQNQYTLDQAGRQNDLNNKGYGELDAARTALNEVDPDAANFDDQIAQIRQKYPNAFNAPATAGLIAPAVQDRLNARSGSTVAQLQTQRQGALEEAQVHGLLGSNINIRREVQNGNADALTLSANRQFLTNRLGAIVSRGDAPTRAWASEMLSEVNNPKMPGMFFNQHGVINQGVEDQIGQYERALNITPPYGGITSDVKVETDEQGRSKSSITYKNVPPGVRVPGQPEQKPTGPIPTDPKAIQNDPIYQDITKNIPPGLQGDAAREWARNEYIRRKTGAAAGTAGPAAAPLNPPIPEGTPAPAPAGRGGRAPAPPRVPAEVPTRVIPPTQQRQGFYDRRRLGEAGQETLPEGSWQAAWRGAVGGGPTPEETRLGIQESLARGAAYASTEGGVPAGYQSEQPSPSPARGGGGSYTPPSGAPNIAGIDPSVWGMVMREEGPEFDRDGGHPAVFGLWGDKPGVESQAYSTVRQYGSHSPEAYQAVTRAWTQGFLQPSRPWELRSPGMQGLVISDSQHQGGYSAARIIQQMGGWDSINAMDPRQAVEEYSRLRTGLWGSNQARVRREEAWALANP